MKIKAEVGIKPRQQLLSSQPIIFNAPMSQIVFSERSVANETTNFRHFFSRKSTHWQFRKAVHLGVVMAAYFGEQKLADLKAR